MNKKPDNRLKPELIAFISGIVKYIDEADREKAETVKEKDRNETE